MSEARVPPASRTIPVWWYSLSRVWKCRSVFTQYLTVLVLCALLVLAWWSKAKYWVTIPPDLDVFRRGGQFVLSRQEVLDHSNFISVESNGLPFVYPPFGAMVMVPLALVPGVVAFVLWTAASLGALAWITRISFAPALDQISTTKKQLVAIGVLVLLLIPTGPVSELIPFGQIGAFIVLLCLLDACQRTGRLPQGVLVGLATAIKLVPAVFILYWIVTGRWRAAIWSCLTIAFCWTTAALWMWQDTRTYFLDGLIFNATDRAARPDSIHNQSWGGTVARLKPNLDGNSTYVYLLLAVATIAGLLVAAALLHRRGNEVAAVALVGFSSVLAAPVAWNHHAIWIIPALGAILGNAHSKTRTALTIILLIAGYHGVRSGGILENLGFHEYWLAYYLALIAAITTTTLTQNAEASFVGSDALGTHHKQAEGGFA